MCDQMASAKHARACAEGSGADRHAAIGKHLNPFFRGAAIVKKGAAGRAGFFNVGMRHQKTSFFFAVVGG